MTREQAETLVAGQKIQYWDGRMATVVQAATLPETPTFPTYPYRLDLLLDVPNITINFDDDPEPKPIFQIKSTDFARADILP